MRTIPAGIALGVVTGAALGVGWERVTHRAAPPKQNEFGEWKQRFGEEFHAEISGGHDMDAQLRKRIAQYVREHPLPSGVGGPQSVEEAVEDAVDGPESPGRPWCGWVLGLSALGAGASGFTMLSRTLSEEALSDLQRIHGRRGLTAVALTAFGATLLASAMISDGTH